MAAAASPTSATASPDLSAADPTRTPSGPPSPRPPSVSLPAAPLPATPPELAATSSGRSLPGRLSRTLSAQHRRQSTQDRLNNILETARQRAETLAAPPIAPAAQPSHTESGPGASSRHATFVRMEPLLRNQSAPGAFAGIAEQYESSADEAAGTGPVASGPRGGAGGGGSARHINYQSTATTGIYGSVSASPPASARLSPGPRARKAAVASGRDLGASGGGSGRSGGGASSRPPSAASTRRGAAATAGGGGGSSSRWKAFWAGFQSIELENKGSVARDHLALERTFLAWLRTSLAFTSIGIAVTQLFRLNTANDAGSSFNTLRHVGRPLGATFLAISVLVLFLGYHRYYQSQQWILQGKFPASRGTILLVSLVAFALMVTSLVVVVVVRPPDP